MCVCVCVMCEIIGTSRPALTEILGLLIPGSCWAFHTRIAVNSPGGNISLVSSDSGRRQSTPKFFGSQFWWKRGRYTRPDHWRSGGE